jgi:hypothetical protein
LFHFMGLCHSLIDDVVLVLKSETKKEREIPDWWNIMVSTQTWITFACFMKGCKPWITQLAPRI